MPEVTTMAKCSRSKTSRKSFIDLLVTPRYLQVLQGESTIMECMIDCKEVAHLPISIIAFNFLAAPLLEEGMERRESIRQILMQRKITVGIHGGREKVERCQPINTLFMPDEVRIMSTTCGVVSKASYTYKSATLLHIVANLIILPEATAASRPTPSISRVSRPTYRSSSSSVKPSSLTRFFDKGVKRLLRTEMTVESTSFIPMVAFRMTVSVTSSPRVLTN